MSEFSAFIIAVASFLCASVSSEIIGRNIVYIKLPLITGYLAMGMLTGPQVLEVVRKSDLPHLKFVNQFALAAIAFAAGAEIYFPELKRLFRSIMTQMTWICIMTLSLTLLSVTLLSKTVDFMHDQTLGCRISISLMCGAVMIARSPSSALALITGLNCKGPMTKMLLGVTVVSDIALLVTYAITQSIATAECLGGGFDALTVVILISTLIGCAFCGYVLGQILLFYLWIPRIRSQVRGALILPTGYAFFVLSDWFTEYSFNTWKRHISFEPLLVCMIASCIAGNQSINRRKFANILHKSAPFIYVPFFTLTGASLNANDISTSLYFASIVFLVRMIAIASGSYIAGKFFSNNSMKPKQYKYMWMTLTTQAGAALGLASEIANTFDYGKPFASGVTTVVIFNQIIGPIMFKYAMSKNDEIDKGNFGPRKLQLGHVVMLGMNKISLNVADRLAASGCPVDIIRIDGASTTENEVSPSLHSMTPTQQFEFRESKHNDIPDEVELQPSSTSVSTDAVENEPIVRISNIVLPNSLESGVPANLHKRLPNLELSHLHPVMRPQRVSTIDEEESQKKRRDSSQQPLLEKGKEVVTGVIQHIAKVVGIDDDEDPSQRIDLNENDHKLLQLLQQLIPPATTKAFIACAPDDKTNLFWCELLIKGRKKCPRLISIVHDASLVPQYVDLGVLVAYSPSTLAEVLTQLTITHSTQAVQLLPATGLNVIDVGDLVIDNERNTRCILNILPSNYPMYEPTLPLPSTPKYQGSTAVLARQSSFKLDQESKIESSTPQHTRYMSTRAMSSLFNLGLADEDKKQETQSQQSMSHVGRVLLDLEEQSNDDDLEANDLETTFMQRAASDKIPSIYSPSRRRLVSRAWHRRRSFNIDPTPFRRFTSDQHMIINNSDDRSPPIIPQSSSFSNHHSYHSMSPSKKN